MIGMNKISISKYVVLDMYGTRKNVWTLRGAMSWINFCSPDVIVWDRWKQKIVIARKFRRTGSGS